MDKEQQELSGKQLHEQLLETCLMGNESAIGLAYILADASHFFDDIVDLDPIKPPDVYRVLRSLMVDIHYNAFWQQYQAELLPLLNRGISSWIASNDIEVAKNAELMHVSMITKSAFTPILLHMAQLIGGVDHERNCAPLVYQIVFDETLDEYMEEHKVAIGE